MGLLSRGWHTVLAGVVLASPIVQVGLLVLRGTDVTTGVETEAVGLGTRFVRFLQLLHDPEQPARTRSLH